MQIRGRSYSDELCKWMEVGNSGMFRPEMLRPMGMPEDVSVIAWGLSLERYASTLPEDFSVIAWRHSLERSAQHIGGLVQPKRPLNFWAACYSTCLLVELTPKGVVLSFLFSAPTLQQHLQRWYSKDTQAELRTQSEMG